MLWLILGGILLTIGDIIMKKWVQTENLSYFLFGLIFYIVSLICLAFTFREKNIAVASLMLIIFNVVILSVVSWLFFSEPPTLRQFFGLCLGISAIVMMELS
jgi:multidrug transporter EmrE-like cation transporter